MTLLSFIIYIIVDAEFFQLNVKISNEQHLYYLLVAFYFVYLCQIHHFILCKYVKRSLFESTRQWLQYRASTQDVAHIPSQSTHCSRVNL